MRGFKGTGWAKWVKLAYPLPPPFPLFCLVLRFVSLPGTRYEERDACRWDADYHFYYYHLAILSRPSPSSTVLAYLCTGSQTSAACCSSAHSATPSISRRFHRASPLGNTAKSETKPAPLHWY